MKRKIIVNTAIKKKKKNKNSISAFLDSIRILLFNAIDFFIDYTYTPFAARRRLSRFSDRLPDQTHEIFHKIISML